MRFANLNPIGLHYRITGNPKGPAVLFLNPLGTDLRIWDRVVPGFEERFRVVRMDNRGHGLSDAPEGPYTISEMADDVARLLEYLEIASVTVVGLSIGGMIAQALAASNPERVYRLVLCDTGHVIGPPELWEQRTQTVQAEGLEAVADTSLERWLPEGYRQQQEDELPMWRNLLLRTPVQGYLGACAALRDADLTESTRNLKIPTLVLCGSEDAATPPELGKQLADLIEGAEFDLIEGAAHLPCIDRSELFGHRIRQFLAQ